MLAFSISAMQRWGSAVLNLFKTTFRLLAQGDGGVQYQPAAIGTSRKTTLRAKGIIGLVVLVAYVAAAGLLMAKQRERSLLIIQELESVHLRDDALTKVSTSLAHAVLVVNEAHFDVQATPRLDNLVVSVEAVQAGLQPLQPDYPSLARFAGFLERNIASQSAPPARAALLDLRDNLHALVVELDTITRAVRQQGKTLSDNYRLAYDAMTVIAISMGLAGFVLFGGLSALFFSRLAWDLTTLEQRARQVVRGYRGEPLRVTRNDEVGGLMNAVNQMQFDLRSRERQLEMVRQQRFHQEKMAAVGSLAASIAHEINNPIAAITGAAQEMRAAQPHSHPHGGAPSLPELILEQAQRIARITRQISDLAAPQSAQAQWMDLNGLLRRICNFVSYDQRLRGTDIDLDLDSQLPAIHGVPDELSQIALNLLLNAADAVAAPSARRGRIVLSSRVEGDTLVLAVTDNGDGMGETARAHAFDEGYTTKSEGSGLGLFICKSLVEARGGTIALNSAPGVGTTVQVRLPQQREHIIETEKG